MPQGLKPVIFEQAVRFPISHGLQYMNCYVQVGICEATGRGYNSVCLIVNIVGYVKDGVLLHKYLIPDHFLPDELLFYVSNQLGIPILIHLLYKLFINIGY